MSKMLLIMKKTPLLLMLILALPICHADIIFLDNHSGVVNGSMTYEPTTRTCGKGSCIVYTNVSDAAQALLGGDTLYVRDGVYSQPSVGKYILVHGNEVSYWTGILDITASGTPEKHTVVRAYKNELVIIQAKEGINHYNPDPADESFRKSSHYYPNPAIGIHGAYIDVIGFKTYGQVVISGHDITLRGCDFGGGGPHMNQGQVIALNGTDRSSVYNVVIQNSKIHHSCWGESARNGAAIMCYNVSFVVENNEFYDNYGPDICTKDTGGQQGRTIEIRYNFFGPTSINRGNAGVNFHNQDAHVDWIYVHHNIFYNKGTGVSWSAPGRRGAVVYNNTFANCGWGQGETGDIGTWQNQIINVYNNLYYHSKPDQKYYDLQTEPWNRLNSDYNLFYSTTGDTSWWHLYRKRCSTLAAWQRYSENDKHSVEKNPCFIDASGNRPEDFKRRDNPGDVTGSSYGPVCGAYVTGNEVIGIDKSRALE